MDEVFSELRAPFACTEHTCSACMTGYTEVMGSADSSDSEISGLTIGNKSLSISNIVFAASSINPSMEETRLDCGRVQVRR